jgi:ferrous iron transport protein A
MEAEVALRVTRCQLVDVCAISPVDANANSSHLLSPALNRILLFVKSPLFPPDQNLAPRPLADLRRGQTAVVLGLLDTAAIDAGRSASESLVARLRDLGFVTGAHCEVIARMWPGGDPLAVRVGGSTFALRRAEAAVVQVRLARAEDALPVTLTRTGTRAAAA